MKETAIEVNPVFWDFIAGNYSDKTHIFLLSGGRASGKSRAVVQKLVKEVFDADPRIALVRKVADTIRGSQYQEIMDYVREHDISGFRFVESRLKIGVRGRRGGFICRGLDKAEKIKSLANVDVIWVEEATELTQNDWLTLSFTIRGKSKSGRNKIIILTFNPKVGSWINDEFYDLQGNPVADSQRYYLHTTYKDNCFLDDTDLLKFEKLRQKDPDLYNIVALGKWEQVRGLIYPDWETCNAMPDALDWQAYGVDFGFIHPSVLVEVGTNDLASGHKLYVDELLYRPGLTDDRLIEEFTRLIPTDKRGVPMYCDNSRPQTIAQLRRAGFNAIESKKGANSVYQGIMAVKGFDLIVTDKSDNIKKELATYKWKEDKTGALYEEPVKIYDDAMDALRYPIQTYYDFGNASSFSADDIATLKQLYK